MSVEHGAVDLRVVNLRPTLGVEFTSKKKKKKRYELLKNSFDTRKEIMYICCSLLSAK